MNNDAESGSLACNLAWDTDYELVLTSGHGVGWSFGDNSADNAADPFYRWVFML